MKHHREMIGEPARVQTLIAHRRTWRTLWLRSEPVWETVWLGVPIRLSMDSRDGARLELQDLASVLNHRRVAMQEISDLEGLLRDLTKEPV